MRTALFVGLLVLSKSIAAQTGFSATESEYQSISILFICFVVADVYELIVKD